MADDTTEGNTTPESADQTDPQAPLDESGAPDAGEVESPEYQDEANAALAAAKAAMAGIAAAAANSGAKAEALTPAASPSPFPATAAPSTRLGTPSPRVDGQPQSFSPPAFDIPPAADEPMPAGIELLSDVDMGVKIELGRASMFVEDVLRLSEGCVIELDKLAGDPVDIFVNGRHIARGEVLVLNDSFCVRVSEILAATDDNGRRAG